MKTSARGLALIKSFEGCRLQAYMPTPNDVPTIGYGHTRGVRMGDTCTQKQADRWLREDLGEAEDCVVLALDDQPTQNQFDAMVSLCYNIGCLAFRNSTLVRLMNAGKHNAAALQFARWNKQAGKVLVGLVRRRAAEQVLFLD